MILFVLKYSITNEKALHDHKIIKMLCVCVYIFENIARIKIFVTQSLSY